MKKLLPAIVCFALAASARADLRDYHKPAIIMYHDVVAQRIDATETSDITRDQLTAQMQYLADNGYVTVSMEELYDYYEGKITLPQKSVALTFDDGYLGTFKYGLPILQSFHFKATFFVHSGYVGAVNVHGSRDHVSWDKLREVDADSDYKVYSHTVTHPTLDTLTDEEIDMELRASQERIVKELGGPRPFLAYPFGRYDRRVIVAARKYYTMALGISDLKEQWDPMYQLPRLEMQTSKAGLNSFSAGLTSWLEIPDVEAYPTAKPKPEPTPSKHPTRWLPLPPLPAMPTMPPLPSKCFEIVGGKQMTIDCKDL